MRNYSPAQTYRILLTRFGFQGWWPVAPSGKSRPEYHPGRFKIPPEGAALEIAVGAILTQNTAWSNVEKAISALHDARALSFKALSRVPNGHLGKLIRSSGYFRQKAIKLKAFLRRLSERGGNLRRWLAEDLADIRRDLLEIKGVGPETADSILLYAGGRPAFVVDAYTLRIGSRIGWFHEKTPYHDVQRHLVRNLPRSVNVYQEFHALLVALAKFFCRSEPVCLGCPLQRGCAYGLRYAQ